LAATPTTAPTGRHPSGLEIVGPTNYHPPAIPDDLRTAWREALALMHNNPDAFGYPWADHATGQLVLSAATPAGDVISRGWTPRDEAARKVPRRIRAVDFSMRSLDRVQSDLHGLVRRAALPDSSLIHQFGPDLEWNRVIIAIDRLSDPLLVALAARFGTRAVAIRVEQRLAWRP
jgi:hypothetical protein